MEFRRVLPIFFDLTIIETCFVFDEDIFLNVVGVHEESHNLSWLQSPSPPASSLQLDSSASTLLSCSTIDQAGRRHIFASMSHSLVDGNLVLGLPSGTAAQQDLS